MSNDDASTYPAPPNDPWLDRCLMIRHIWAHHTKLGGSGVICDYLPGHEMCASNWPWGDAPAYSRSWNVGRRIFDSAIIARSPFYRLIHFIHAENHPRLAFQTMRRISPRTKLLGTIHLPLDYYDLENSVRAFRHLHGIIALARWQVEQVRELMPDVRAWWVPCGFDMIHGFRPQTPAERDGRFRVVTIGSNYRDWAATEAILDLALQSNPEWRFHMVGIPAERRKALAAKPNVIIEPRLDESAYFALIARCDTLLLPLTFATNNTAVLEAYSVGTPTLCSDLPAIHDYAVSTTRTFKTAEDAVAVLAERASAGSEDAQRTRDATTREGRRFDWRNVAHEVRGVYKELLDL